MVSRRLLGRFGAAPAPGPAGRGSVVRWEAVLPYVLMVPITVLVGALVLYPMSRDFLRSFYGGRDLLPNREAFVGLANYRDLTRSADVTNSVAVTAMCTGGIVTLTLLSSMACALLLSEPLRARGLARAALTVPWKTPWWPVPSSGTGCTTPRTGW